MVKNKKGWVRIIEVFLSITLVAGVVLVLLTKTIPEDNLGEQISSMEKFILNEIRINDSLRTRILNVDLPTNWSEFEVSGLKGVVDKIDEDKFSFLECEARICSLEDPCKQNSDINGNVYANSIVISSNIYIYNPRQMRLFCWEI